MKHDAAITRSKTSAACAALAEHLRDGPLKTMAELQTRAAALADRIGADDAEAANELAELVLLAQSAMTQFRVLTGELKALVNALTEPTADKH
jgi:hypothetical protein